MKTMAPREKFSIILILGLLTAIGPFSIDMYLPAFLSIARDLGTTEDRVALSLSSFFIGISAGQFIYGPVLDRFGRKKPLYIGLAGYTLASLGCALASSVDALIGLRLLQALGGCAGMVASRAMVRDLFPVQESAKVFSTLMLVVGVSPIIAPTAGGYISSVFGWQYVFVVLTVIGALILAATIFLLPESRKPDPQFSLKPAPILRNFWSVLQVPQFYTYALTGSFASAGLYAYISGSPFVFMQLYGVSEQQYGWIFALIAAGLIGSSQLNSLLLRWYSSEQIIRIALLCQVATGLLLVGGTWYGWLGLASTILLIFLFLCCQGFTFPNSSALSLAPFSRTAGSASALMGGIQMGIGAATSAAVSLLNNHTALPMTATMAGCSLISFSTLLIGRRVIRYKERLDQVEEEAVEMIL
ncbi:multidrug effflux MFS transporter [Paraflavisolibacter sp. H34]|uniref:multidrug effflux MFS transporter n=1 Tax=Huijunlia imazamoxiresistens TaxID=3127457 RepID=UPI003019930D